MTDTSARVNRKMCQLMGQRSGFARLKMGADMFDMAKRIVIASILSGEGPFNEIDVRRELFLRFYGMDFDVKTREKILKYFGA